MSEYSKKTVADLQEILKSRGLVHTGKKADLIARLTEADKTAESPNPEPEPVPELVTENNGAAQAAAPAEEPQSTEVPTQGASGQTAAQSADTAQVSAIEEKQFSLNLAASDIDAEMEKRRRRAEKFKTGDQEAAPTDAEALKNLERAKKFGTGQSALGMLDSALSTERERGPRGKKRAGGATEESTALDDPGLKSNFNRNGRHGRDKRRKGPAGAGAKPTGITKTNNPAYTSDKDKAAAEARKKKFSSS